MKTNAMKKPDAGCCTKPALKERPLLSPIQAGGLAAVFKVLANDTRLRLLHALVRADELCVTDLANSVGMKPQAGLEPASTAFGLGHLGITTRRQQHPLPTRGPLRALVVGPRFMPHGRSQ